MTHPTRPPSDLSPADWLTLACALVMLLAFLFMPWVNLLGLGVTGVRLLSEAQNTMQNDVSALFLVPTAAVVGGLAALWGMLDPSRQRLLRAGLRRVVSADWATTLSSSSRTARALLTQLALLAQGFGWRFLLPSAWCYRSLFHVLSQNPSSR